MSIIIAFSNQKGGVGKTTTVVNIGAYLASLGKKVLLVDMDPQGNATTSLGFRPEGDTANIYRCLIDDQDPHLAIVATRIKNYFLLPGHVDLAGGAVELLEKPSRAFVLRTTLQKISSDYDMILIDCPPSLGILTINGLAAAQHIIIPVQCEYFALEGLSQLMRTISLVRERITTEVNMMGILLTMYDKRNRFSEEIEKEVRKCFPHYVFKTVIPRSVYLAEAPSYGKTIMEYRWWSSGACAYKDIAQEIMRLIP